MKIKDETGREIDPETATRIAREVAPFLSEIERSYTEQAIANPRDAADPLRMVTAVRDLKTAILNVARPRQSVTDNSNKYA